MAAEAGMGEARRIGTRYRPRGWAFLGLLGMVVAGLGGAARAEGVPDLTFVMPNAPVPYLLPFLIAQDLGWYAEAGLVVNEKVVTGDANSLRALISGSADVTYAGSGSVMQAAASGARLKILVSWQAIADYQVVARPGISHVEELADKRWASAGTGTMTQAIPEMLLRKHGATQLRAQFFPVGGFAARYQALIGGSVDATLLDTYFATLAEDSGRVRVLASVPHEFPGLGYNYVAATEATDRDPARHRALEIFVAGGLRGVRYLVDQPAAAARILEARLKGDDVALMAKVLQAMTRLEVWGINGGLERATFDNTAAFYRQTGMLTAAVDYAALVDPEPVAAALAAQGRR